MYESFLFSSECKIKHSSSRKSLPNNESKEPQRVILVVKDWDICEGKFSRLMDSNLQAESFSEWNHWNVLGLLEAMLGCSKPPYRLLGVGPDTMILQRMEGRLLCRKLTTREFDENFELYLKIVNILNFQFMVTWTFKRKLSHWIDIFTPVSTYVNETRAFK